jgi:hypothetical protein
MKDKITLHVSFNTAMIERQIESIKNLMVERSPVGGDSHGWVGEYNRGWNDCLQAILNALEAPKGPLISHIDPRWADIDFDKVNAELRDLRAQVGRLQAHIDRTQPVAANAEGYVEAPTQAHGEVEYFGLEPWERDKLTSPTAGMNIAQRILHVGGRNNEAGYVEFGSIQAVEALVRQVLRDLPAQGGPNA